MTEYLLINQKLDDHIKDDDRRFGYMEENIISIKGSIEGIKTNHLAHVQKDVAELKDKMVGVRTDLIWLKKFFWIVTTASIGSLVAGVINLILRLH